MPDKLEPIFGLSDEDATGVPEQQGDAPVGSEPEPNQTPQAGDQQITGPDQGHPDQDAGTQPQGHSGGTRLWAGKYQSPEELERSYQELQRKLGEQGQQLGQMQQQYQQLIAYLQQMQTVPQQPQVNNGQTDETMDPVQFVQELETKGPKVVEQLAERVARRILEQEGQALGQGLQQFFGPMYQYYTQAQLKDFYRGQVEELKSKYQDFSDYSDDMKQVLREQPTLLLMNGGMETAYLVAKARKAQSLQQQVPQTAAMQQATTQMKRAAQMPSASGGGVRAQQQQTTPEEALKQAIFGDLNKPQGIFG